MDGDSVINPDTILGKRVPQTEREIDVDLEKTHLPYIKKNRTRKESKKISSFNSLDSTNQPMNNPSSSIPLSSDYFGSMEQPQKVTVVSDKEDWSSMKQSREYPPHKEVSNKDNFGSITDAMVQYDNSNSNSIAAAAGHGRGWDIINKKQKEIRAASAFMGKKPIDIYRYLQRIQSKVPQLDTDAVDIQSEKGQELFNEYAEWDSLFSTPESYKELLETVTPVEIDPGKFIHPVIAAGWSQGRPKENKEGIFEPVFYKTDENGMFYETDEEGKEITWDKTQGKMPYFVIDKNNFSSKQNKIVNIGILAHGQYYGLKELFFCLNDGCTPEGPMVIYEPVASIGNANYSGPKKDGRFYKFLKDAGINLDKSTKAIFETEKHYEKYKRDLDVQINSLRSQNHIVTSNICLPNKLFSFTEYITKDKIIPDEHANHFNYGVYLGENNLDLPTGIKIDIDHLLDDGDVTSKILFRYLIHLFDLVKGDTIRFLDTSCQCITDIDDDYNDPGGKKGRANRRATRSLEKVIEEINEGKDPLNIYKGMMADKTSDFGEYLKRELNNEKNLKEYQEEGIAEFLKQNALGSKGGYKKRQTKKLKSGLLKNAITRKPGRKLKRNTKKMYNKSRKKHHQLNISRKQFKMMTTK
jgi:hypothetical protein